MIKLICYSICFASLFFVSTAVSNGSFVSIKTHPYYVAVTSGDGSFTICGASIISDKWILTAGHCVGISGREDVEDKKIRSGSSINDSTGLLHDIQKVIVHGAYEQTPRIPADNDIALIKLKNPLKFSEMQNPVKIRSEPVKLGDTVVVVGLGDQGSGHIFTPVLKTVALRVTENYTCDDLMYGYTKLGYQSNSFCAGGNGTDACSGDSGGPVVLDNELVGLVSYGPLCDNHVNPNESGAFTIIHNYRDWIYKHTGIW